MSKAKSIRTLPNQRRAFEGWMRQQWRGISLIYQSDINEYSGLVQIAWEVWQRMESGK